MLVNHSNPTCCQFYLFPILNDYLKSKSNPTILEGACYGLVLHHCVKKFQGDEHEHIRLVQQVCAEKFEGVSKSDELLKFCHRVVQFQNAEINNLRGKINSYIDKNELELHSSFHFTASYSYNSSTESHDQLAHLLKIISSVSTTAEKYIFLKTEDHVLGIAVKGNSYSYYDPNNTEPPITKNEITEESFAYVASDLTYYSVKQSLLLGIEVITTRDISSDMNECEELKQLQKEILKRDPNQKNAMGCTPFMIAMMGRNFDNAKELYDLGANPDHYFGNENAPIYHASVHSDIEALELLVSMKADVNLKLIYNRTPLWYAAYLGQLAAVRFLLKKGAKVLKDSNDMWFLGRIGGALS